VSVRHICPENFKIIPKNQILKQILKHFKNGTLSVFVSREYQPQSFVIDTGITFHAKKKRSAEK